MSQENVETLLEIVAAYNRGDVPTVLRLMDPEIRFECQLAAVQGIYIGHNGVNDFVADLMEHYEVVELHCPDVRDLGDRVLALGTARSGGRGSGIDFEAALTSLGTVRNGRMTDYQG